LNAGEDNFIFNDLKIYKKCELIFNLLSKEHPKSFKDKNKVRFIFKFYFCALSFFLNP
jgi:hypothetical protein